MQKHVFKNLAKIDTFNLVPGNTFFFRVPLIVLVEANDEFLIDVFQTTSFYSFMERSIQSQVNITITNIKLDREFVDVINDFLGRKIQRRICR